MRTLFTMEGRLGRQQYVMLTAAVIVSTYFLAFLVGVVAGVAGAGQEAAGGLGIIVGFIGGLIQAFLTVRRLHDLGRSGWHFWLLAIPLYNLYLYIVLLFTPGHSGSNEYGADPVTA